MSTAPARLSDPGWFLDELDFKRLQALFVHAGRDELSRQPFLDPRWDRGRLPRAEAPGAALDAPEGTAAPLNFIWHTSFCCSTVIAAALDVAGRNLSLKEPRALVDLADLKRGQRGLKRPGLARAVFGLYARRFAVDEQVLVKPSNFANTLMTEAAEMTRGRSLMLYSSPRSFLVSIVKEGEGRRSYARDLFLALAGDGHPQGGQGVDTLLRMTDLQMAALAWRMQMAAMRQAMEALGERAVSLDADAFLRAPGEALTALDRFFNLGIGEALLAARAEGSMLATHAKTGAPGAGRALREAEAAGIGPALGAHIDLLVDWAAKTSPPQGDRLPRPLL